MELLETRRHVVMFFVLIVSALCLTSPEMVLGQDSPRITFENIAPQKVSIAVGKSINIESPVLVKRIYLVSPEIADAMVLTPRQIYITGKAPGVTNLTLWGVDNKVFAFLDLEVSPDVSRLRETIQKILPEEKDITVTAMHDSITLSGTVSSASNLSQVLALAEPYSPKKVVNLLKVETEKIITIELIKGTKVSESKFERGK